MSYKLTEAARKHVATIEDVKFGLERGVNADKTENVMPEAILHLQDTSDNSLDIQIPLPRFKVICEAEDDKNSRVRLRDLTLEDSEDGSKDLILGGITNSDTANDSTSGFNGLGWRYALIKNRDDEGCLTGITLKRANDGRKISYVPLGTLGSCVIKGLTVGLTSQDGEVIEGTGTLTVLDDAGFEKNIEVKGKAILNEAEIAGIEFNEEGIDLKDKNIKNGNKLVFATVDAKEIDVTEGEINLSKSKLNLEESQIIGDEESSIEMTNADFTNLSSENVEIENLKVNSSIKGNEETGLKIDDNVTATRNLNVVGDTSLTGMLEVEKKTVLKDQLSVKKSVTAPVGYIDTVHSDSLTVNEAATIANEKVAVSEVTMATVESLKAKEQIKAEKGIDAKGSSKFEDAEVENLSVENATVEDITVNNNIYVKNDGVVNGKLSVNKNVTTPEVYTDKIYDLGAVNKDDKSGNVIAAAGLYDITLGNAEKKMTIVGTSDLPEYDKHYGHIKAVVDGQEQYLANAEDIEKVNDLGFVDRTTNQTVGGSKRFTNIIQPQGGIGMVETIEIERTDGTKRTQNIVKNMLSHIDDYDTKEKEPTAAYKQAEELTANYMKIVDGYQPVVSQYRTVKPFFDEFTEKKSAAAAADQEKIDAQSALSEAASAETKAQSDLNAANTNLETANNKYTADQEALTKAQQNLIEELNDSIVARSYANGFDEVLANNYASKMADKTAFVNSDLLVARGKFETAEQALSESKNAKIEAETAEAETQSAYTEATSLREAADTEFETADAAYELAKNKYDSVKVNVDALNDAYAMLEATKENLINTLGNDYSDTAEKANEEAELAALKAKEVDPALDWGSYTTYFGIFSEDKSLLTDEERDAYDELVARQEYADWLESYNSCLDELDKYAAWEAGIEHDQAAYDSTLATSGFASYEEANNAMGEAELELEQATSAKQEKQTAQAEAVTAEDNAKEAHDEAVIRLNAAITNVETAQSARDAAAENLAEKEVVANELEAAISKEKEDFEASVKIYGYATKSGLTRDNISDYNVDEAFDVINTTVDLEKVEESIEACGSINSKIPACSLATMAAYIAKYNDGNMQATVDKLVDLTKNLGDDYLPYSTADINAGLIDSEEYGYYGLNDILSYWNSKLIDPAFKDIFAIDFEGESYNPLDSFQYYVSKVLIGVQEWHAELESNIEKETADVSETEALIEQLGETVTADLEAINAASDVVVAAESALSAAEAYKSSKETDLEVADAALADAKAKAAAAQAQFNDANTAYVDAINSYVDIYNSYKDSTLDPITAVTKTEDVLIDLATITKPTKSPLIEAFEKGDIEKYDPYSPTDIIYLGNSKEQLRAFSKGIEGFEYRDSNDKKVHIATVVDGVITAVRLSEGGKVAVEQAATGLKNSETGEIYRKVSAADAHIQATLDGRDFMLANANDIVSKNTMAAINDGKEGANEIVGLVEACESSQGVGLRVHSAPVKVGYEGISNNSEIGVYLSNTTDTFKESMEVANSNKITEPVPHEKVTDIMLKSGKSIKVSKEGKDIKFEYTGKEGTPINLNFEKCEDAQKVDIHDNEANDTALTYKGFNSATPTGVEVKPDIVFSSEGDKALEFKLGNMFNYPRTTETKEDVVKLFDEVTAQANGPADRMIVSAADIKALHDDSLEKVTDVAMELDTKVPNAPDYGGFYTLKATTRTNANGSVTKEYSWTSIADNSSSPAPIYTDSMNPDGTLKLDLTGAATMRDSDGTESEVYIGTLADGSLTIMDKADKLLENITSVTDSDGSVHDNVSFEIIDNGDGTFSYVQSYELEDGTKVIKTTIYNPDDPRNSENRTIINENGIISVVTGSTVDLDGNGFPVTVNYGDGTSSSVSWTANSDGSTTRVVENADGTKTVVTYSADGSTMTSRTTPEVYSNANKVDITHTDKDGASYSYADGTIEIIHNVDGTVTVNQTYTDENGDTVVKSTVANADGTALTYVTVNGETKTYPSTLKKDENGVPTSVLYNDGSKNEFTWKEGTDGEVVVVESQPNGTHTAKIIKEGQVQNEVTEKYEGTKELEKDSDGNALKVYNSTNGWPEYSLKLRLIEIRKPDGTIELSPQMTWSLIQ